MVLEAQRAAEILAPLGVSVEVVDVRSLTPIDIDALSRSAAKTGRLIVVDTAHTNFGCSAEIVAAVVEAGVALKHPPRRIALPWSPTPTSPSLAEAFYPRAPQIVDAVARILKLDPAVVPLEPPLPSGWHDVPDPTFKGPY
jgi:pyruvate dehydrogenase E1 component beta subunit